MVVVDEVVVGVLVVGVLVVEVVAVMIVGVALDADRDVLVELAESEFMVVDRPQAAIISNALNIKKVGVLGLMSSP